MENTETNTPQTVQEEEKTQWVKMIKPNNVFNVDCSSILDFFKWWCVMLRPFIKLTDRETDVIASFLKQRWELSKSISNESILDTVLMSEDTISKVVEECNMTRQYFYVIHSTLKSKGVISKNGIIHKKLIPNTRDWDNGTFRMLIKLNEASI